MPIARVQLPDGRIARIEVPEDATQDQIESFASQHFGSFDDEPENDLYTPPQAVEPEKELEVVEPKNVGTLENIAREVSAGAVSGVGYGAQGFGSMFEKGGEQLAKGLNWTFDTDFFRSDNVLSGAADAVNKYSKEVEAGTSQDWREAKQGSSPTGDISDPSTWNWGEDPSLKGYAAQVLNVFGQAGPMAALAVATRGQSVVQQMTGMGTVGAAVTIGAGEKEISEEIEGMSHADLLKASELYKDRVSIGDTPEEAKLKVVDTISDDAFWKLAAIGGVGGLATGYVLGGLASKAGAGLAAKAAAEGVGEGTEELLEGIAKNDSFGAAGIKKDLMEGSLGNFVLGALGGATTSVATSPFDSDPTKKIAKALEAEVDASGYAVPASEVARQQFDPSREAASITAQLDRAQSVEEVIDIASSNIELDIATPAATIPGIDLGDQGQEYAQDIAPLQDITEAPAFTPEQGIEQLEGAGRNLLTEQLEPSTIPTDAPIEEITPTLPVEPEDRYAKDYEDIAAAKEQEGWTTEPKQPKSKGAQIPVGEPVTLKHRSPHKFDQLDDTKFGKQLGAPTSQLGHFMGVDDIGKPEIYGENIKDFEVTIKKPAYMDFDTYQSLDEKTDAEVKQIRQDFIDEGYDAVIIEDLGHVAVLSGESARVPSYRNLTDIEKGREQRAEERAKAIRLLSNDNKSVINALNEQAEDPGAGFDTAQVVETAVKSRIENAIQSASTEKDVADIKDLIDQSGNWIAPKLKNHYAERIEKELTSEALTYKQERKEKQALRSDAMQGKLEPGQAIPVLKDELRELESLIYRQTESNVSVSQDKEVIKLKSKIDEFEAQKQDKPKLAAVDVAELPFKDFEAALPEFGLSEIGFGRRGLTSGEVHWVARHLGKEDISQGPRKEILSRAKKAGLIGRHNKLLIANLSGDERALLRERMLNLQNEKDENTASGLAQLAAQEAANKAKLKESMSIVKDDTKSIRQDFIDEGYDAVIIEDLGHVAVLSGESARTPQASNEATSEDIQSKIDAFEDKLIEEYGDEALDYDSQLATKDQQAELEDLYSRRHKIDMSDLDTFTATIVKDTGLNAEETVKALEAVGISSNPVIGVKQTSDTLRSWSRETTANLSAIYNRVNNNNDRIGAAKFYYGGTGENPKLMGRVLDESGNPVPWDKESLKKTEAIFNAVSESQGESPISLNVFSKATENLSIVKDDTKSKRSKESFAKKTKVDESKDSLLTASSKLGGLNIEAWEAEGIDPEVMKDRKMNNKVFGKPAFRRKGGMTPDDLAEIANQYGYGQDLTANDVLDLVTQELGGDPIYTPDGVVAKAERDLVQQQEDAIMQELDYNPTEYEFLTEGMDAEQEALFHASVSMDIDPDQYPDQETLQAGVTEAYDNYARTVAEDDQAGQEFALKQETEAQRQQREAAETEQALTAKTAEDAAQAKAQADKEVGEFTLTGSNRVADIAASQGQQDIFGAKPEKKEVPLKDIKISEEAITPDGDTVAITRTADNVIKDIDSRIDGLKLLKGCIGG